MLRTSRFAAARGCEGVLALILANGRGRALVGLTAWQTKAAVPFGGQYRIVDFVLSNCVNSGIRRIALLTQYKSQSLIRHVHSGWGFLHRELGEFVEVWPAQQQDGERWYRGTVDAVFQNSDLIEDMAASHVLVLAGDQIYALDYAPLIEVHAARDADLTVACVHVTGDSEHDEVFLGADGRIDAIEHRQPAAAAPRRSHLAPMGVYLFSGQYLVERLGGGVRPPATADFARDLVPELVRTARVFASVCDAPEQPLYWRTLNSVDRYWQAHMELLDDAAPVLRQDGDWPIFTRHEPLSPARVHADAHVDAAMVSLGAVVAGHVTHSVVSTRCRIGAGAVIRDSVLLPGANVGDGCVLDKVVVDCDATIPPGTALGTRLGAADANHYASPGGIVLATAARRLPPVDAAARAIA